MVAADTAASQSLVGAVLSRKWRLARKLGDGGMGSVYAADPVAASGPRVAVKMLRSEFRTEAPVLARFMEEGRTAVRLIHPNIVRVIESGNAEDGTPYIVMELLDGVPLGAYTQNGGRVPLAQAVPILHGILAGLAAAHAQGIVHRDLKPDNVFLSREQASVPAGRADHPEAGATWVVKVLDFGIAKVMDVAGGMGSRTRTGMLLGTPAYMSPEQIKNARDVDQRADLWSAGVMFYEMITGRVAFPAPTEYARLAAVLTTEPPPAERIDPSLAPVGPFLARALLKDRDQRFQTALEMARALTAAMPHMGQPDVAHGKPAGAIPLSRLPDVPSVFAPSALHASTPAVSAVPSTAPAVPATAPVDPALAQTVAPGSTLASPTPAQAAPPEQQPHIVVIAPQGALGETLPSKDLPMLAPGGARIVRGVAPLVVVMLVTGALLAGFLLGWAFARSP
jgi:serine/threonine protein kinase